jgi:hypothetical protein
VGGAVSRLELEEKIRRLKKERDGPHTMIEDLSSHLHWFDQEIARLQAQAEALRKEER